MRLPHTSRKTTFQSTLPVRGATFAQGFPQVIEAISIHAPRAGSDMLLLLMGSITR